MFSKLALKRKRSLKILHHFAGSVTIRSKVKVLILLANDSNENFGDSRSLQKTCILSRVVIFSSHSCKMILEVNIYVFYSATYCKIN